MYSKFKVYNLLNSEWLEGDILINAHSGQVVGSMTNDHRISRIRVRTGPSTVIVESTGVFDANGTMIYRGDILQYVQGDKMGAVRGPVEFRDGKYSVPIRAGKNPLNMAIGTHSFRMKHIVIGNVFENAELLLAKKSPKPKKAQ